MTRISKKHGTRSAKKSKLAKGVKGTEMDPEFQDEELQKKLKKITVLKTVWWYPVYNMRKYMLDPNPQDFVPVRTLSYDVAEGKIFFDFKKPYKENGQWKTYLMEKNMDLKTFKKWLPVIYTEKDAWLKVAAVAVTEAGEAPVAAVATE